MMFANLLMIADMSWIKEQEPGDKKNLATENTFALGRTIHPVKEH